MPETFLHGVEVIEIDTGPRPIRTVRSSVIGIVGTAPDADPAAFPLNTPVLIAGSRAEAALLDITEEQTGAGTLPRALDGILDQIGAVVVVVRVEEGTEGDEAETLANILGGVNATTGQYEGVHALLGAESVVGFAPRILCVPGYTHQRQSNGITTVGISAGGTGYTNGTFTLDVTGGGGSGAEIEATVAGGIVTAVVIRNPGSGYSTAPTLAMPAGAGAGTGATFTTTRGTVGNAVVAELLGIAERLRAVIIADGPNTTDAAAIAYGGDFGSPRVYVVDPWLLVQNGEALESEPPSARVAGLIAKIDNDRGFWWSPSNQIINGIVGTARPVDFKMGDANARANLLNEQNIATVIRQNGFRLWGNRTLSSDPKWAFLCVRRTADILNDSLQRAHLWAVDRPITRNYLQEVAEGVNAYIRSLIAQGALLGGKCWADPDLNSPANISDGKVFFNFDFTAPYPAEHITFRSILTTEYLEELV